MSAEKVANNSLTVQTFVEEYDRCVASSSCEEKLKLLCELQTFSESEEVGPRLMDIFNAVDDVLKGAKK